MDWVDAFIADLRGRSPPNVGLVGPACEQGAKWILTHDFTHRTHAAIFGWHYPRSLPDWSSDDWITFVYKSFTPPLMVRREDIPVIHELHGTVRAAARASHHVAWATGFHFSCAGASVP